MNRYLNEIVTGSANNDVILAVYFADSRRLENLDIGDVKRILIKNIWLCFVRSLAVGYRKIGFQPCKLMFTYVTILAGHTSLVLTSWTQLSRHAYPNSYNYAYNRFHINMCLIISPVIDRTMVVNFCILCSLSNYSNYSWQSTVPGKEKNDWFAQYNINVQYNFLPNL